ncbi:MAG TPA: hypothetical protein VE404_00010 [Verrucomicrobiae bacterium]|nr:hypothetical protein [Verrucomicrobiae bacterium]
MIYNPPMSSAAFLEIPLVRALLRTLLFTTILEAIFYRLLTLPPGLSSAWTGDVQTSTSRAGLLMFLIGFALLVPAILSIAYAALRAPAWPHAMNPIVSIGLLAAAALGISAAFGPRGPLFALGFALLSAFVSLLMLASLYETRADLAGRLFAILLGAHVVASALAGAAELANQLAPFRAPFPPIAMAAAARWLFILAGLAAFPAFAPGAAISGRPLERAASFGFSAASAFTLILGAVVRPASLSRIAAAPGVGPALSLPVVLRTTAAAAALFLTVLTACRCFARPETRLTAYGLAFVLLSGHPHRVAYEHLLAVCGLALLSATAAPKPLMLPLTMLPGEPTPAPNA